MKKEIKIGLSILGFLIIVFVAYFIIKSIYLSPSPHDDRILQLQMEKLKEKLNQADFEGNKPYLVLGLGEDNLVKFRAGGTASSGEILFARRTISGNSMEDISGIMYNLKLDESLDSSSCVNLIGKENTSRFFLGNVDKNLSIDKSEGDTGFGFIKVAIPLETPLCTQKVRLTTIDNTENYPKTIAYSTFTIQILRKSLFD